MTNDNSPTIGGSAATAAQALQYHHYQQPSQGTLAVMGSCEDLGDLRLDDAPTGGPAAAAAAGAAGAAATPLAAVRGDDATGDNAAAAAAVTTAVTAAAATKLRRPASLLGLSELSPRSTPRAAGEEEEAGQVRVGRHGSSAEAIDLEEFRTLVRRLDTTRRQLIGGFLDGQSHRPTLAHSPTRPLTRSSTRPLNN
eukprot:GHVU01155632.1.p1 GENE.GHVU01155632.1~~GHVU01155632.1.p1  ORF type:complete len:212 (+),score=70.84 GHVU01155632.1:51-638(+)